MKSETQVHQKKRLKLERAGKTRSLHWLVLLGSLLLTLVVWYLSKAQTEEKIRDQFLRETAQVTALISERMQKYEDALWGGVAAIRSQSNVIGNTEWKLYADSLKVDEKYPGINGIGVINYVAPENLSSFLAKQQEERPNFQIHPTHERNEYWPITFIEPFAQNEQAVGLDMAFEFNRYTAAVKARNTGTAQITAPIVLVQDSGKTPGFLFYSPFYSDNQVETAEDREKKFLGLVYAPFIMHKLMEGSLAKTRRHVGVKITDGDNVLYNEHLETEADFDADPLYTQTPTFEMYGRSWSFDIRSTLSFREAANSSQPLFILLGGLFIDALLFLFFTLLARSNQRALQLAGDMSEKYQVQARETGKKEQQLSAIVEAATDGLITIDAVGNVISFNPACEQMFGYSVEEVLDKNIKILMPAPIANLHDKYLSTYKETKKASIIGIGRELVGRRKNGNLFPIELGISEIDLGDKTLFSGIIRDISDRKRAENEKQKFIEQLANSNQELERFAFICSHDLQEPMRMIQAYSSKLKSRFTELNLSDDDISNTYLEHLLSGAERGQDLIRDILAYSRISNATKAFTTVDTNQIALRVVELMYDHDQAQAPDINFPELPHVRGNETQLLQLFQNIVSNGLKYVGPGETARVDIAALDRDTHWEFTIADNGIGIEKRHQDKVFEVFKRLHRQDEYSGTGIGLSICRKIIENHHGTISIESEYGQGTTIRFTLLKADHVKEEQI